MSPMSLYISAALFTFTIEEHKVIVCVGTNSNKKDLLHVRWHLP